MCVQELVTLTVWSQSEWDDVRYTWYVCTYDSQLLWTSVCIRYIHTYICTYTTTFPNNTTLHELVRNEWSGRMSILRNLKDLTWECSSMLNNFFWDQDLENCKVILNYKRCDAIIIIIPDGTRVLKILACKHNCFRKLIQITDTWNLIKIGIS